MIYIEKCKFKNNVTVTCYRSHYGGDSERINCSTTLVVLDSMFEKGAKLEDKKVIRSGGRMICDRNRFDDRDYWTEKDVDFDNYY